MMAGRFDIVKKGYNVDDVDSYINNLETALKSYKEKETAIKNALISSQIAADNITKSAEIDAQNIKDQTYNQLVNVRTALAEQRRLVEEFKIDYVRLIEKYLGPISEEGFDRLFKKVDVVIEQVDGLVSTKNNPAALKSFADTRVYDTESIKRSPAFRGDTDKTLRINDDEPSFESELLPESPGSHFAPDTDEDPFKDLLKK